MRDMQATLKPLARIQRYEALPHRATTLELALHHIAASKYARSWELLVQVGACPCAWLPRATGTGAPSAVCAVQATRAVRAV
jgi:hypothetical protein